MVMKQESSIIIPFKKRETKPYIGVIIQARQTSTRFPGKSMALLDGKPVLQHVIEKAKQIRPADLVVLAVPDTDESEPMLQLADKMNISNFCGSELNVLDRFYRAAQFYKMDFIIRITADCPFLNPRVASEVIQLLLWRKLDYASNLFPVRTYPKGLDTEAFSYDCLEAAHTLCKAKDAGEDLILSASKYELEHVTPWMQTTDGIKRGQTQQKIDASDNNWCVDVPEDIERLEKIVKGDKIEPVQD